MPLRLEDLVGTWQLEAFAVCFEDGRQVFPMGSDARGLLIYAADGSMSATLSRADRAPLPTQSLESFTRAPLEAKATAFDGYLSYAGHLVVEDDAVVHEVEFASVPNIVGARQRRHAQIQGDSLTLSYEVIGARTARRNVLRWRRR